MTSFKVIDKILVPAVGKDGREEVFSEDALYVADGIAALFDGATGVGERRVVRIMSSDSEWFANKAGEASSKITDVTILAHEYHRTHFCDMPPNTNWAVGAILRGGLSVQKFAVFQGQRRCQHRVDRGYIKRMRVGKSNFS